MQMGRAYRAAARVVFTWTLVQLSAVSRAQDAFEPGAAGGDERAAVIYSNSGNLADPFGITRPGAGCSGRDISDVQTMLGLQTYGFNCYSGQDFAVADDFGVPAGATWTINEVVLYLFQTNATAPSIGTISLRLQTENPLGQPIPALTPLPAAVTWTAVQKNLDIDSPGTVCNRRLQQCVVTLNPPYTAPAGNYWLIWQADGSTSWTGPWVPPVVVAGSVQKPGANALGASNNSSGLFVPLYDGMSGHPAQDLVFVLRGTVQTQWQLGDTDCNGHVDFGDINPFVLALNGEAAYLAQYPNCVWLNADCNQNGTVEFGDINPFVALLTHDLGG